MIYTKVHNTLQIQIKVFTPCTKYPSTMNTNHDIIVKDKQ